MEVYHTETAERGEEIRLGFLLKHERERMNLSQDDIAQKIRLRRFMVEAIENEAWERLPPPVFVKGFLRSYAKTLELDERKVLDLYHRTAPPEPEILKPVAVPASSHRVRPLLFLLLLAALGCTFYFWYVKASMTDRENPSAMDRAVSLRKEATRSGGMGKGVTSSMSSTLPKPIAPAAPEPKPRELSTPSEHKPQEQSAGSEEKPQELSTAPEQKPQAMPPPGNKSEPVAERALPELSLTGVVKQRTWMSIRVDGHKPKEFIFQPGARPQWRAAKGFEIVVGNAAGVDFELDGKKIQNLGKSGQVVRLSLPEGPDRTDR